MSPEMIREQRLDGRSDIYALGIMMYRMLTGTMPFSARDLPLLLAKQVTEIPEPLRERAPDADIPGALERAVLRALEKDPALRPARAHEFALELSVALVESAEPSPWYVTNADAARDHFPSTTKVVSDEPEVRKVARASDFAGEDIPASDAVFEASLAEECNTGAVVNDRAEADSSATGLVKRAARVSHRHIGRWIAGAVTIAACVVVVLAVIGEEPRGEIAVQPVRIRRAIVRAPVLPPLERHSTAPVATQHASPGSVPTAEAQSPRTRPAAASKHEVKRSSRRRTVSVASPGVPVKLDDLKEPAWR
jgi:hypothetical protein